MNPFLRQHSKSFPHVRAQVGAFLIEKEYSHVEASSFENCFASGRSGFSISPALADQWPVFDHIKLTPTGIPPVLTVVSDNNSSWTRMLESQLRLSGIVDIKLKKGNLIDYRIAHSNKVVHDPNGEIPPKNKSIKEEISFQSSTGNLGIAAAMAIGACNAKLKTGAEIFQDQFTGITTDLTLFASATGTASSSDKDITRDGFGSFPITVKCLAVPINQDVEQPKPVPPPTADVDDLKPGQKFRVRSADIGIHKPQSNVCPRPRRSTPGLKRILTARLPSSTDRRAAANRRPSQSLRKKCRTENSSPCTIRSSISRRP